ncbi:MAG: hypothetical protein ABIY70_22125 [Capsulimonas sp.]|uniref:hypothetical protein n=1 Tax=Capsulimonas sp. TaxID=2494211 RepID=UPI00326751D8
MLDTYNQLDISYAQLKKVLSSLGFAQRVTSAFTAFRDVDHDAMIMLPLMANHDLVGEAHLIAVNNTIVGKGIISEEDLLSRFQEAVTDDSSYYGSSKAVEAKATGATVKTGAKAKIAAGSALSQTKSSAKTMPKGNTTFAGKALVTGRTSVISKIEASGTKAASGRASDNKPIPGTGVPIGGQTKRKK